MTRLLFLQPVPRFVGFHDVYGPFEPGDIHDFPDDEPFVDVLLYRSLATRYTPPNLSTPAASQSSPSPTPSPVHPIKSPATSKVVQSDLSRWL